MDAIDVKANSRSQGPNVGEVLDSFDYHAPTPEKLERIAVAREMFKATASVVMEVVPPGADRSAAIRHLREAMMTANAAIVLGPEVW